MVKKRTLKKDIRNALIITALVPTFLLGVLLYYNQVNSHEKENYIKSLKTMNIVANSIDQFDEYNRGIIRTFSEHPVIKQAMREEVDEDMIVDVIMSYYNSYASIENIYLGVSDGRHYSRNKAVLSADYDPRTRTWYKLASKLPGNIMMTEPYENMSEPGTYMVAYAVAITDSKTNEVIGVVACDVKMPSVEESVRDINVEDEIITLVTDANGRIISGDIEGIDKELELISADYENNDIVKIGNTDYKYNAKRIISTQWRVITLIPMQYIINRRIVLLGTIGIILILILIVAYIIAAITSADFLRHIEKLVKKLRVIDLESVEEKILVDDVAHEEIESIAGSINVMLDRIYVQADEVSSSKVEISEQYMEINSLYEETTAMNDTLYEFIDKLEFSYKETIQALSNTIEAKDIYTQGHCSRVTRYASQIAEALEYSHDQLIEIENASLLHDVGKVATPERILNKPGKLTDEEYKIIQEHPVKGYEITKNISSLKDVAKIIRAHHERVDGKGYPDGLTGADIVEGAKILCVADAYDAMTSARSYRLEPLTTEAAINELTKGAGTQFDRRIVEILINILKEEDKSEQNIRG